MDRAEGMGIQDSIEQQEGTVNHENMEKLVETEKLEDIAEKEKQEDTESLENIEQLESIEKQKNKRNRIVRGIIISLITLLVIYFGMAIYFINHFYFGSEINGISVSGKSVEKVKEQMTSELMKYTLNLKERGGKTEQISAAEIGLKHYPEGAFDDFKSKQNPLKWISAFFYTEGSKAAIGVSYDDNLLKERVDKLTCFDKNNIIGPESPAFKYTDNGYVIIDEVNGNKVDKDILYSNAANAVLKRQAEVDLEAIKCYINPLYTSKSQKIIEARDMLNKYAAAKVTYTFGETKEVLDGSIINKWLTVDEDFKVILDEARVKSFIQELSKRHTETGKIRNFFTSSGKTIDIGGGDYTRKIDTAKEAQELIAAIKEGKIVTKETVYVLTDYVEIDLTRQHLWFYKNGLLLIEGDIVSGHANSKLATPPGVYRLKYKKRNAVLRGPGYAAPVAFWMPFNGGIGIHDATWRSRFGGTIYKVDGSHGCINCPYSLAETIYNNIAGGTPIICYY